MNQDNIREEVEGVVFGNSQEESSDDGFTPVSEEKRKNLAEFYSPLFHRRVILSYLYWLIVLAVVVFVTLKIMLLIRTFAQESYDYQTSLVKEPPLIKVAN